MDMIQEFLGLVVAIAIILIIVFVICLSILIYLSEDRKILEKKLSKLELENKEYFEKYANYKIKNAILSLKVELLESYTEGSDDNE